MDHEVLLRGMTPGDIPFVTNSWLENYRRHGAHVKGVPNSVYFSQHHKILERIIPRSTVLIACDPKKPHIIYGWMCAEVIDDALVFHYAYVKDAWKAHEADGVWAGFGIGQLMFHEISKHEDPRIVVYTHDTRAWRGFLEAMRRKGLIPRIVETVYNPYLLYSTLPEDWNH